MPRLPSTSCRLALTFALLPSIAIAGSSPFFTGLGDLPGGPFKSAARGVSKDGSTVVGYSVSSSTSSSTEAFRWTEADGMSGLGDFGPGAPKSVAYAASWGGSVIACKGDSLLPLTDRVAARWTAATGMVALTDSTGEARGGQAFDVSTDGSSIVGVAVTAEGNEAFRWTAAGGVVGLGWLPADLNDSFAFGTSSDGEVVCGISSSGNDGGVEPIRWTQSTGLVGLGDVPGGLFYAIAWAVSGDGSTLVGSAISSFSGTNEMFVWTEASSFILPDPTHGNPLSSEAFAVSGDGSVAVGYGAGGAMIWDAAHGMRILRDVLTDEFGLDLTGWTLSTATDVSNDGSTIVGDGRNPAGQQEAWMARISTATGVEGSAHRLGRARFVSVSPNPFTTGTTALLRSPFDDDPGFPSARAAVFGPDGRWIRTLALETIGSTARGIRWDGRDEGGAPVVPGVYLLRVVTPRDVVSLKLVRVR